VKTEERMLLQFHYTEWHSHTTPFTNAVLEFRRRVRSVVGNTLKSDRPMLVHCNDGGEEGMVAMVMEGEGSSSGKEGDFPS
jgi:protein tyrosine phosphatase